MTYGNPFMLNRWLCLTFALMTGLCSSCEQSRIADLQPYGLPGQMACEGNCRVHMVDLIVTREITLDKLQLLILSNHTDSLSVAVEKQKQAARAEEGFEEMIMEDEAFFAYAYQIDGEPYYQFRQLYQRDSVLVIMRAHPKNRLHREQAEALWDQAATFTWK
jgi:hypothetical protein